jgi:hypothetical protein
MSYSFRAAGVAALLSLASVAFAATTQASSVTIDLNVTPSTAAVGSTVLVTAGATNNTNKTENLVATYNVTGPCGYTDTFSNSFSLGARKHRSASESYTVPACAGTYTIEGSVSSNGNALAVVTTSFTAF